ncbi:MAG: hypothetical protein WC679_00335 [Bacteroidales bacterium]|jgi:hypothetical protein
MKSYLVINKKKKVIFTTTDVTRADRSKEYANNQCNIALRIAEENDASVYSVFTDTDDFNELIGAVNEEFGIKVKKVVTFSWDFEIVANNQVVKYFYVEGLDGYTNETIEGLSHEQSVKLIKQMTKAQGKEFINNTDDGIGPEFRIAVLNAYHERAC